MEPDLRMVAGDRGDDRAAAEEVAIGVAPSSVAVLKGEFGPVISSSVPDEWQERHYHTAH